MATAQKCAPLKLQPAMLGRDTTRWSEKLASKSVLESIVYLCVLLPPARYGVPLASCAQLNVPKWLCRQG
eukprot:4406325-Amphidinium_carterae.1